MPAQDTCHRADCSFSPLEAPSHAVPKASASGSGGEDTVGRPFSRTRWRSESPAVWWEICRADSNRMRGRPDPAISGRAPQAIPKRNVNPKNTAICRYQVTARHQFESNLGVLHVESRNFFNLQDPVFPWQKLSSSERPEPMRSAPRIIRFGRDEPACDNAARTRPQTIEYGQRKEADVRHAQTTEALSP